MYTKFEINLMVLYYISYFHLHHLYNYDHYLQVDYYLQEVIILKKFNEVDSYDLTNSIKEPLSFYKFKNFKTLQFNNTLHTQSCTRLITIPHNSTTVLQHYFHN